MDIYQSRVGKKSQTVIPHMIRETAGIEEGDRLLWEITADGTIVVRPQKNLTETLYRLNRRVWTSFDRASGHVAEENAAWEPSPASDRG